MESIANVLMLVFTIIASIGVGVGFNQRKLSGWMYILCGFLIGPLLGITIGDLKQGIGVGILIALLAIWGGSIMFKRRQQFKEKE